MEEVQSRMKAWRLERSGEALTFEECRKRPIRPLIFPLQRLPEAMDAAAVAANLDCVALQPHDG